MDNSAKIQMSIQQTLSWIHYQPPTTWRMGSQDGSRIRGENHHGDPCNVPEKDRVVGPKPSTSPYPCALSIHTPSDLAAMSKTSNQWCTWIIHVLKCRCFFKMWGRLRSERSEVGCLTSGHLLTLVYSL